MPETGPLLANPAVISGGIGGVIALLLLGILYKSLSKISDTITVFNQGQLTAAEKISKSIADAIRIVHEDRIDMVHAMDAIVNKLDLLLDRTNRAAEQIAIHRGVVEPSLVGTPPAVLTTVDRPRRVYHDKEGNGQ